MDLNWPATALILGLVALLLFRGSIAKLLDRTEKVKDWLVAPKQPSIPAGGDQGLPTPNAGEEQRRLEVLTRGFNSQLLLIQEEAIRADLAEHGFAADSACEKVLVRHLAGSQIALLFEKIHNEIFGSQLRALRWLNSQPTGVIAETLRPFYDSAAATWPTLYAGKDFRSWLAYLALRGLITESEESMVAGDDEDPFDIAITVMGREFLAFLVDGGRADPTYG